ncbi:MAG: hypothetical protein AB1758_08035, partial [Candidatus Eremiobacterota bacterium]
MLVHVNPSLGLPLRTSGPPAARAAEEDAVTLSPTAIEKPSIRRLDVFVDPPQPVPRLPRPVLLIPGGRSRRIGLSTITHYLTHGGNNSFGGSYNVDKRTEFEATYQQHGGNVFCLHYSHKFASFEHNAAEIEQAIADIRRVTGHDEIDVVAECKGSQEFREYISQGHDGVRNVIMMVPPNSGLPVGGDFLRILARGIQTLHLPVKKLGQIEVDRESLKAMQSFSTDWSLGPYHNNPHAHRYNSPEQVAKEQKAFHSLTVIGGDGENLFEKWGLPGFPFPSYQGDESVPKFSAYMPHGENFFYKGDRAAHAQVNSHPGALAKLAETLVSDGKPARDENFVVDPPNPAGRVVARSALWLGSFAGRVDTIQNALTGA